MYVSDTPTKHTTKHDGADLPVFACVTLQLHKLLGDCNEYILKPRIFTV